MIAPQAHHVQASVDTRTQKLAQELQRIEKRDWWIWIYTVFVILLLTFAVIALTLPALHEGAETIFKIKLSEVVFGLIALVFLFNFYTIYQQILIKRLRRQLAENQGHSDLLRNLAMIDPLTGLYNRRFAEQRLAAEVARSERKGHPLTILTLDLNNFKQINDTFGHPAGDQVLQEFAARLNKVIRGADLAVRLGGTNFLFCFRSVPRSSCSLCSGASGHRKWIGAARRFRSPSRRDGNNMKWGSARRKCWDARMNSCMPESGPARTRKRSGTSLRKRPSGAHKGVRDPHHSTSWWI